MQNLMSNFSGLALTRMEMKKVTGGCMPPHWDVTVDGVHTACMLTKGAAKKAAITSGAETIATWTYNPGTC